MTTLNTLDTLLKRNKDFADHQFAADLSRMPSLPDALKKLKALIVCCADPRTDPTRVLGIEPGEAVVVSTIGGRITPSALQTIGLLGRVAQVAEANAGGGNEFNLIVLHHTDCGITRLTGSPDMLANYFGIGKEELKAEAISDPYAAVAVDVAALRAIPALPGGWLVSGLVYDVTTGLVDTVVPPAPLRDTKETM